MTIAGNYPAGFREGQECDECEDWLSPGDGAEHPDGRVLCRDCMREDPGEPVGMNGIRQDCDQCKASLLWSNICMWKGVAICSSCYTIARGIQRHAEDLAQQKRIEALKKTLTEDPFK